MTYSPWADAAERHPDIHIERWDISPARGAWVASERVILIDRDLTQTERRCTLAHELAHIDLGHVEARGWFARRLEREADRLAAKRLLADIEAIADAICTHPLDPDLVAEQLGVTLRMLRKRLKRLTPSETSYIEARLAAHERGA